MSLPIRQRVSKRPLYQSYSKSDEKERTNKHYARPSDFFQLVTGGEWNVYSCNLWDDAQSESESQVAKLKVFGTLACLRPGQRILDVGCGWGGSLVYLCKTFGVSGVGLTLSSPQKLAAEKRAKCYDLDIRVIETHWKDFATADRFDLIYSDEVLVHITDLHEFFLLMGSLLATNGSMVHKELHLAQSEYAAQITRASSFINEFFGETGNYRNLSEELAMLAQAGFEQKGVYVIPNWHYRMTIDGWMRNTLRHREELVELAGREFYVEFAKYLRLARRFVMSGSVTIDVVHSRLIRSSASHCVGMLTCPVSSDHG